MQKFFLLTRKHKDPPLKATGSLWEEENENSNMTLWHLDYFASTIEPVDSVCSQSSILQPFAKDFSLVGSVDFSMYHRYIAMLALLLEA
jgi:hypothetical protein